MLGRTINDLTDQIVRINVTKLCMHWEDQDPNPYDFVQTSTKPEIFIEHNIQDTKIKKTNMENVALNY